MGPVGGNPGQARRNVALSIPETGEEEWLAVREPIMSGWLTQGPKVAQFEKAFAARHQVKHGLAVTSATTGLHLAFAALGVGPGDEVIVPSLTWVATANAVLYCGATPVLADIDPLTFNLDPADVARRVTPRTKAVAAVHLFGLCSDMGALRAVLPEHVRIVEDGACAAGASYRDRPAGSMGDIGVFSFHPRKSITTGEGGMLTTNDDDLARKMDVMRNHGGSPSAEQLAQGPKPHLMHDYDELGYNYRMTDIQAAVGLVQLGKLDRYIEERDRGARRYADLLSKLPWLRLPYQPNGMQHAWQAYVTTVDPAKAPRSRNEIMAYLSERGVATRPGTHAVHMLGLYANRFGFKPDDLPGARDAYMNSMAIPLHNRMTDEDFEYVAACFNAL